MISESDAHALSFTIKIVAACGKEGWNPHDEKWEYMGVSGYNNLTPQYKEFLKKLDKIPGYFDVRVEKTGKRYFLGPKGRELLKIYNEIEDRCHREFDKKIEKLEIIKK